MENLFTLCNLTREDILEIYKQGPEAVIFKMLELTKILKETALERDALRAQAGAPKTSIHPSTPSGAIPVYEKENMSQRGRKKPGRKKGHKGERRGIPAKIDQEVVLRLTHCPECGGEVNDPAAMRERYIEDIPVSAPIVTKYVIHRSFCKRCNKLVEPKVTAALPKSNIGLNLVALSAWFHYGLGTTINHIIEVLNFHLQFTLSKGGLVQMWKRLSTIFFIWYEQIAHEARTSAYLHADETGWRVNGKTHWLWCFTNKRVTCYYIDKSRGSPALQRFFGEIFEGVLITDFWRAYNKVSRYRQACFVHFFREIAKVTESNTSDEWHLFCKKLVRWMRDALRLDEKDGISLEKKELRKERLHLRLREFISSEFNDEDCRRIKKRLREYQDSLLTFLDFEDVPADNNHAEREIRPSVIMRKNSGQNKSLEGAHTQAVLMSVYRTLKIRGHNPISSIVTALTHYIDKGVLPKIPEPISSGG
jgi:transposase